MFVNKKYIILFLIVFISEFAFTQFEIDAKYLKKQSGTWSVEQENLLGRTDTIFVTFSHDNLIYDDTPFYKYKEFPQKYEECLLFITKISNKILTHMNEESKGNIIFVELQDFTKDNIFIANISYENFKDNGEITTKTKLYYSSDPDNCKFYLNSQDDRHFGSMEEKIMKNLDELADDIESEMWWAKRNGKKTKIKKQ